MLVVDTVRKPVGVSVTASDRGLGSGGDGAGGGYGKRWWKLLPLDLNAQNRNEDIAKRAQRNCSLNKWFIQVDCRNTTA